MRGEELARLVEEAHLKLRDGGICRIGPVGGGFWEVGSEGQSRGESGGLLFQWERFAVFCLDTDELERTWRLRGAEYCCGSSGPGLLG